MNYEVYIWIALVLVYLFCGLLYTIAYLWNYQTGKGTAALGFMVVGWPVYILAEIVMALVSYFGIFASSVNRRLAHARYKQQGQGNKQ